MHEEILIPISMFAAIFGILYVFLITRNKERMAMIEKGADPNLFTSKKLRLGIKLGLLMVGVATGILAGQLLTTYANILEEAAMFSMILLFGGVGLIIDHSLAKKEEKNDNL